MNPSCVIPASELEWRFSRSGGPGGQHANTSDTRVEVSFDGPADPFWVDPTPMSVPVVIEQGDGGKVKVDFDGTQVELDRGAWSDWVSVKFTRRWRSSTSVASVWIALAM